MLSPARRLMKLFHPEGIPWPGSILYNALSRSAIFQRHYELVARDILSYASLRPVARASSPCLTARMAVPHTLLDIGTGPAWLLLKLHEQSPALHLTGLDASAAMIARSRKNLAAAGLADAINLVEANASALPFPDAAFDLVVSTGSVHHWKDTAGGLNEVHRVLKPGGHALLYDLVSDTPASVLRDAVRQFGRFRIELLRLHSFEEPFHSSADFQLLARSSPFGAGDIRYVGVLCCLVLAKQPLDSGPLAG